MVVEFKAYVKKQELCTKEEKLLLAVSGGVDSVVLLDLFLRSSYQHVSVAHCNFNLRGEESQEDESFVRTLAARYNVSLHVKSFDVEDYLNEQGGSIQMAARNLRYMWFRELCKSEDYNKIVTAHHLSDSFETALYNLSKGTGVAGLRGIKSKSGNIIRPLLFATKDQILKYARDRSLIWRDDSSNESDKYRRNRLRHHVVPELMNINPNVERTFSNTSTRLLSVERLIEKETDRLLRQVESVGGDKIITYNVLRQFEVCVIESWLKDYKFNFDQVESILESMEKGRVGRQFFTENHVITMDRDVLYLSDRSDEVVEISISRNGNENFAGRRADFCITTDLSIIDDHNVAKLDAAKLNFPLTLRTWREGDSFIPLGMKGKKMVSDFMIDIKIPLNLKGRVCVLTSEDEIVWVVGHRISDRFKITKNTKQSFMITVKDD